MPIFGQTRPFSKSKQLSCPHFVKERPFSQENGALMSFFFNIFQKIPPTVKPTYYVEKSQFYENYTILRSKKVNRMPFSPIFQEKMATHMPIFHLEYV